LRDLSHDLLHVLRQAANVELPLTLVADQHGPLAKTILTGAQASVIKARRIKVMPC
jgi:hypothetical protein